MMVSGYKQMELPLRNRNEAYDSIKDQLGERQRQVLAVIRTAGDKGISSADIARRLHLGVNQVTGRVFELRQKLRAEAAGETFDYITNRKVTTWKVKNIENNGDY